MAGELLASKIVVIEEEPRIRALPGLPTAVLGAVGFTERGPLNTPKTVTGFSEFESIFGRLTSGKELPTAIRMFFLNGGSQAIVVRAGSGGATATVNVLDSVPATTLVATAAGPGTWANYSSPTGLRVLIKAASSGDATEFNLEVEQDNVVVEQFPNLTRTTTASNYAVTVVNKGSNLVTLAAGAGTGRPANANLSLAGGTAVTESAATIEVAGLAAFDTVNPTILIAPDSSATSTHNALITYAETTRNREMWAILDPPSGQTASGAVTAFTAVSPTSEQSAAYWPRIVIPNPSTRAFGTVDRITIVPSGAISGMVARNDANTLEGPWRQPAGVEDGRLFGIIDVETTDVLKEAQRDLVFPKRINPITFLSGYGFFVDGARNLKGDGNFPSAGERRGVSFVEKTLKSGLQFARHKNNTRELRDTVNRIIRAFLIEQMRRGAFASREPAKAFFVDTSDALNTASVIAQGKLIVRVGMATNKPAEFIVIRIAQDTRAIDEELLARS